MISLDHVGFIVRDLDAAATRWRRLGFQLASRSPQMGKVPGVSAMAPWATANHCAMFQQGYLELIGVTEPSNFNPWAAFLDRFEGIHITAFRCDDAEATYSDLRQRIDGFDPPLQRQRHAPYGAGTRLFRFRNIFSQDDRYPEGRFIVIEHQTPEVIWQEPLMTHPNGACRFDEVIFRADDVNGATRTRLEGIAGVKMTAGRIALPGGGFVTLLDADGYSARFPGAVPPPAPSAAAVVVAVRDLAQTRLFLTQQGVAVCESGNSGVLWLPPEEANGGVIAFTQA